MSHRPTCLVATALFAFVIGLSFAGEYFERDGAAIGGYDPVAYFTEMKPVKGSSAFHAEYQGSTFYFVLGNKLVVGTVNANREYFEAGVYDFARAELEFPGWLPKLLTHPVVGLDNYQDMMRLLTTERSAIKVYVNVAYDST